MGQHPLYNNTGLQKNNKSHVLYALANKQMELKNLEDEYEAKIAKVKTDLLAMEQVICLFDDDCGSTIDKINKASSKTSRTKSSSIQRNRYFIKGECKKFILKILRESNTKISTEEISLKIQDLKQIPKDDTVLNKKIQKTIVSMLRKLQKEEIIIDAGRVGLTVAWRIKS